MTTGTAAMASDEMVPIATWSEISDRTPVGATVGGVELVIVRSAPPSSTCGRRRWST